MSVPSKSPKVEQLGGFLPRFLFEDWDAKRATVAAHPDLLLDAEVFMPSFTAFGELVDEHAGVLDGGAAVDTMHDLVGVHIQLLVFCRDLGIDVAFALQPLRSEFEALRERAADAAHMLAAVSRAAAIKAAAPKALELNEILMAFVFDPWDAKRARIEARPDLFLDPQVSTLSFRVLAELLGKQRGPAADAIRALCSFHFELLGSCVGAGVPATFLETRRKEFEALKRKAEGGG